MLWKGPRTANTVNQWPADRHDGSQTTEEEGEDENVVILISRMLNSYSLPVLFVSGTQNDSRRS